MSEEESEEASKKALDDKGNAMHRKMTIVILLAFFASGCSSLRPVDMSPEQVREKISAGEILSVGDKVQIRTTDGQSHLFEVGAVTENTVGGDGIVLPIDDIEAVEIRELSGGKTAALAGGSVLAWAVIVALALGGTLAL